MFSVFVFFLTVGLIILFSSLFVVKQQMSYIIERFGKFHKVANPGLNFKVPFVDKIAKKVPLRIMQLDSIVETKTQDNVFVTIPVSVQYMVANVVDSYYRLADPERQIQSYVYDRVRTSLAKLNLDDAFSSKDQIASDVEATLSESMAAYGFTIVNTLVTDINPDPNVRASMNAINAAQREREAAISLAEAEKIKIVKQAEADAEYKRLQGEGVAAQRKAIVDGLAEQYELLRKAGIGQEAQEMLLLTQYFDTLQEVAKSSNTKTLMLPSNPGGLEAVMNEMRSSLFASVRSANQDPNGGFGYPKVSRKS